MLIWSARLEFSMKHDADEGETITEVSQDIFVDIHRDLTDSFISFYTKNLFLNKF